MLVRINGLLEKWIYLIMPLFMLIGILTGSKALELQDATPFLFIVITFLSSLTADFRKLPGLLRKPGLLTLFLIVVHLAYPLAVFYFMKLWFGGQPELAVGITIAVLLPLGVTSIFWVSFNRGNIELILSMVTVDTLLSPLIVPATMAAVVGSSIELETGALIWSLVKLVVLPSILGMAAGEWLRRRSVQAKVLPVTSLLGKLSLYGVLTLNAAAISEPLQAIGSQAIGILAAVFGVMAAGYLISFVIGKLCLNDHPSVVSVAYAGGVRNYTVGVVLAGAFFTPLTSLPVLLAMLLQHPTALLFYYVFRRFGGSSRL
jgi:BASS family bile acid:Na+ symporter